LNGECKLIDLRSDTVTRPTPEMREVMARAEVGDDVFGEDPSINQLQTHVAGLLGREAGLFVPSGSMANQVSIKAHTQPGDEIICERGAHVYNYESGGPSFLSGVQVLPLDGIHGMITAEQIESAIRPKNVHHPITRLICLENTHNRAGGTVFPIDEIRSIRKMADQYKLHMHLDGARLWNASIATDIPLHEYAQYFDSVVVCFSKGLGAPVGSMITGSSDFIRTAHRYRKMFGGAMRQAGVLAAAALHAVQNHYVRMKEDHENAQILARAIDAIPGLEVDLESVQTNIVFFDVDPSFGTAGKVAERLKEKGVLVIATSASRIRVVTHLDVSREQVEEAAQIFRTVL